MEKSLSGYFPNEIIEICEKRGVPKFRANQLFNWLHCGMVESFGEMGNIPKNLREVLQRDFQATSVERVEKREASEGYANKYLFKLHDDHLIETMVMGYKYGRSVCVSTQAGCKMGCQFCASTIGGLARNLTAAEMIDQVRACSRDIGNEANRAISHIVLMGSGEPLDNYKETLRFMRLAHEEKGLNISYRNMTLSTCGIVPAIYELMSEDIPVTLAISLHAPYDKVRKELMPGAAKFSIQQILEAGKEYRKQSGRRVTIEYALIDGVNDDLEFARELAELIRGTDFHVNLIPLNAVDGSELKKSNPEQVAKFADMLKNRGVNVTVRRELAPDIDGACGQLRHQVANKRKG
jgi:23S rRNA (adenine2503-C2)-methyltransferase